MTKEELLELVSETDHEIILADGLEDAFIGIARRCASLPVAVYDYEKAVEVLVTRDGITDEEAREHLDYNTLGAYVGEQTPWFVVVSAARGSSASSPQTECPSPRQVEPSRRRRSRPSR